MKEEKLGRACRAHGREADIYRCSVRKQNERDK
jgi:hypothetical protein